MKQERLSEGTILSIENKISIKLEYKNFIINFASKKVRNIDFKKIMIHKIKNIYFDQYLNIKKKSHFKIITLDLKLYQANIGLNHNIL